MAIDHVLYGPKIRIVAEPAPGMLVLTYDGDQAVWALVRLRKHCRCAVTGYDMVKGEMAYRPIGNQMYRYVRIADFALQELRDRS